MDIAQNEENAPPTTVTPPPLTVPVAQSNNPFLKHVQESSPKPGGETTMLVDPSTTAASTAETNPFRKSTEHLRSQEKKENQNQEMVS